MVIRCFFFYMKFKLNKISDRDKRTQQKNALKNREKSHFAWKNREKKWAISVEANIHLDINRIDVFPLSFIPRFHLLPHIFQNSNKKIKRSDGKRVWERIVQSTLFYREQLFSCIYKHFRVKSNIDHDSEYKSFTAHSYIRGGQKKMRKPANNNKNNNKKWK